MAFAMIIGGFTSPVYAAKSPAVNDPDQLTFVMANLFKGNSVPVGMTVKDDTTLVAYCFAPMIGEKVGKFNGNTGTITASDKSGTGILAPGVADISKGWRIDNKAVGTNKKVAKLSFKQSDAILKLVSPGSTIITVTNSGYSATLPVEVRLPEYSELVLGYGTNKVREYLNFAQGAASAQEDYGSYEFAVSQGASVTLKVYAVATSAQIPGVTGKYNFSVDKKGNGFWYSKDPAVAKVSSAGKLKGVSPGKADVIFTDYLGIQHTFEVTVEPKPGTQYDKYYILARNSSEENFKTDYLLEDKDLPTSNLYDPDLYAKVYGITIPVEKGKSQPIELKTTLNVAPGGKSTPAKRNVYTWSSNPLVAYIDSSGNIRRIGDDLGDTYIFLVAIAQRGKPVMVEIKITEPAP